LSGTGSLAYPRLIARIVPELEMSGQYPAPEAPAGHDHDHGHEHQSFWLWVLCLTGVDYFSTLGYQPSIAFENAGLLSPLATVVLVLVTLFGALPVYRFVAGQSPHGLGSIGMLERLLRGWWAKLFVLVLLGFAATDFVITKTLSAADAAKHLIENPAIWPVPVESVSLHTQQMVVTWLLLLFLGASFLRGFREVIGLAVVLVAVYLLLNAIVVGSGLAYLAAHPSLVAGWIDKVHAGDWHVHEPLPIRVGEPTVGMIALVSLLVFPKLALGLSGFETGVAVMPLIRGKHSDDPHRPEGRIRAARKLLLTAALIMSVYLLGSSLVVATLIEPAAFLKDARPTANERALAYLAHGQGLHALNPLFGPVFGTVYDISTVAILWFAGASAMAGLLNLVPRYLPRYGMAPKWAQATRPLVLLFTAINLFVTWVFDADVTAQGAAYATGVLALMTSACVAAVIERWREGLGRPWARRMPWVFLLITAVFVYTTAANIFEKPAGLRIAICFIIAIVVTSLASRMRRATELRFLGFRYKDEQSKFLWQSLLASEFPVIVPHRPGKRDLAEKELAIRREHRLDDDVPIVFLEVILGDPSEFGQSPELEVTQEAGRILVRITNAASISHTIAAVALELSRVGKPPEVHFGWTDDSPVAGTFGFLLFGEGNVPWMVHELLRRAEADPEKMPSVVVGGK
jgi:hypothetical protein